jgi:multidrug resistance efflux pump
MTTAKIVSLRSRPYYVNHLCFPVDGVLDQMNASIGSWVVQTFDRSELTTSMLGFPTGADPSRLLYDADGIDAYFLTPPMIPLARIVSDAARVALDQAINARSNAYFAKYADQSTLVQAIQNTYLAPTNLPAPTLESKSEHLQNLMQISQQQWTALSDQYQATNFTSLANVTLPLGSTAAVVDHTESDIDTKEPEMDSTTSGSGGQNVLETTTTQPYKATQHITNQDFIFRTPYSEAQAQFERAQLSLADELFGETMRQQTVQNYQEVLSNELNSINLGVYRLQIAYLNTYLWPPLEGWVTGIYKQPGEVVRAGETVVRVEGTGIAYLIATVVYPGLIQGRQFPDQPGMTATIQTSLYDAGGTPTTLTAEVLTARGCGDDDTWELVLMYINTGNSNLFGGGTSTPILPLDYHFDFDNTTISFA